MPAYVNGEHAPPLFSFINEHIHMRIFLTALLLSCAWSLSAQVTASRFVFSTFGSAKTGATLNATQTMGEPLIGTVSTSSLIATQGFQQADDGTVSIKTPWTNQLEVTVFPNPVADHMILELEGTLEEPLQVQLFDASGRLMPGWSFSIRNTGKTERSTEALPTGAYFLRVSQTNGGQVQTLPIIRQ